MQELHLYEYAVIRVVPRVEREEFVNVGIIVFCKKTAYIGCRFLLNPSKLSCLYDKADFELIQENLRSFEMIALGHSQSGSPISVLDAASRFRWLTATRSTMVQCSKVHPGLTANLDAALEKLINEMVM